MAINEAVNIDIDVNGVTTVKQAASAYEDLGDAVSQTQLEAERLAQQFGINDKRTQEAIKVAGRYKQEMEELDFAIDAARGGSDQLFRAAQGVTAGFELAAGAVALFGGESEELEKVMLKVQGAMVFSQGLKDLKEFSPAIKNVAKGFSGPLTKAIQGFSKASKAALASTGIGLLVVAVGSLVAYWDEIKEAISGVSSEQKKLLKDQQDSAAAAQDQLDSVSRQENILRLQGKTEEDIQKIKINSAKIAISELKAQLETQEQVKKSQIESAKRNKDILEGFLKFVSAPLTLLLKGVDAVGKALGKDFGLEEGFYGGLAKMVFDPEEIEQQADESIEETKKQIERLENTVAGFELKQRDNRKKNREQKQAEDKQEEDDKKKKADREFEQWLAQELANYDYRKKLEKKQKDQDAKDDEEEFQQWLAQELANYEYRKKLKDKEADEDIKREQAIQDAKEAIFNEAQGLADAVVGLAGEQSRVGKAIALAQIGADTARALSGALANANSTTPDNVATGGLAGIAKYIALAANILTNSKKAYDLIKAPAPSVSGSSSTSSSAAASIPQFRPPTQQLPGTEDFTGQNRVYVTEADISNTQNKVKVTEGISTVK